MVQRKESSAEFFCVRDTALVEGIEEGILEAKTECYAKDKVKSPPFFPIILQQFLVIF